MKKNDILYVNGLIYTFFFRLIYFFKKYISLFFAFLGCENVCPVCYQKCKSQVVCPTCQKRNFKILEDESLFCSKCGKILVSEKNICLLCREKTFFESVDKAFPLFGYRLWNIELLCRWKMKGERQFSAFFAELLMKKIISLEKKYGSIIVVPVPPRKGKIRKQGWDQVDELCNILSCIYGICVMKILQRNSLVQQKKLDRNERLFSIGKNYSVLPDVKNIPQRIFLLDDIITTGATVESCAIALKKAGCREVFAISLFVVD